MGTVNVTLGDGKKLNLILGQQLENAVTAVVFNFSAWQTELGSGTLGLSVQRHGDTQPYAVVPTVSGTNATWNISELDTAYKGVGEVQVTYTVGSVVKKSTVYKFTVHRSLGENGEYPSPGQTWQEEIEDELSDVKEDLQESGEANIFHDGTYSDSNWRGVTLTWNNGIATLSGTATGGNFTSPNIYYQANAFPSGIHAGDIITFNIESTNTNIYIDVFSYVNGLVNEVIFSQSGQYAIPNNATGMLMRLFVYNGANATGTFSFAISSIPSRKTTSEVLPVIIPTSDSVADSIMASLNKYGRAILGKGTYYIKTPITMPDNSIIQGAGDSTIIKTMSSINAIVVGANCSVENIRISSDEGYTISKGTHAGIWVQGNYESAPLKYNTKISNVSIDGFSLAGIYGKATGYWVADSISAINCKVYNCYAGIYLEDYCEFNRFTNIVCYSCYSGLVNKSGNNVFVNCSFSNNTIGVYLDCEDVDTSNNNGHGAVIGCTINHSNNNNGYGIIARGVTTNGFMFDSCHLWYSKVLVENCTGIVVQNSTFGGGTPTVESYTNTAFFLRNNLFKASPTLTGTMIKDGNYLFDGTAIT